MMITARHYRTAEPVEVHLAGDRIAAIVPADRAPANLPFVAPGLIDIQINGFNGQEFDQPDVNWAAAASKLFSHGVTSWLPTFCTNSREGLIAALGRYRKAVEQDPRLAHAMPGVHVEGPYISDQDGPRGAHSRQHTRDATMEEIDALNAASGGRLRLLTLAPERGGAIEVTRQLARRGVVVAIGHTAASVEQLDAAVRAGACMSTHLGNGSHRIINRHRNYFFDQLADDRLWASFIPDGHHVPKALFRIVLRTKGLRRAVLVSDACGPAGLPPGVYGNSELLADGRLQLKDDPAILAGSSIALDFGVGKAVEMAGLSLAESIDLCTVQPARLIGLADRGRLEVGAAADLVLFDWQPADCRMTVVKTFVGGQEIGA